MYRNKDIKGAERIQHRNHVPPRVGPWAKAFVVRYHYPSAASLPAKLIASCFLPILGRFESLDSIKRNPSLSKLIQRFLKPLARENQLHYAWLSYG